MLITVALFIMLKLVPDHLKTKQMCNYAVKKLPYLLRYFLDWYKTKKMCNRAILKNGGTLGFVPGWYKTHEISNKAVDNYDEHNYMFRNLFLIDIRLKKCVSKLLNYPKIIILLR